MSTEFEDIINSLQEKKYYKSYIEHSLNLPLGSINKWIDKKDIEPEVIALFRIINLIPSLIELAENDYEI